jgi:hypothetical protein
LLKRKKAHQFPGALSPFLLDVWLYRGFLLWVITIKALSCRQLCTVPLYEERAAFSIADAQQVFTLPKVALKAHALSDLEG